MGLSLNNIYQRPYVQPDKRGGVKRREDEKTSTATQEAQKEQQSNQNSRSKGLQNLEQKQPTYTPAYEQKFSLPAQNAYSNVNINYTNHTPTQTSTNVENQTAQAITPTKVENQINIAQILKDFKNTALAIGTPDDLNDIVDGYIAVIEKQVKTGNANKNLVKNTLNSAASILDNYISETLNKDSKVVENWVDALFLQNIDLQYNEDDINERFLVKFPDGTTSQTQKQDAIQNADTNEEYTQQTKDITSNNTNPKTQTAQNSKTVPVDKELKSLFIKAKKYTYTDKPEEAIKAFEQALKARGRTSLPGTIMHSDQGSQYCSQTFQNCIRAAQMRTSMSRKGECWDNAVAESFWNTIKREVLGARKRFLSISEAIEQTESWTMRRDLIQPSV